jgi:peptidyl-prolyl cis-trans isomerase SurA
MRKKIFLALCGLLSIYTSAQENNPIVLEINNKPITKSEFLKVYLKNNPNPKFDKAAIDEYLNLYKKFKFKVLEAQHLGYDTLSNLRTELAGYRKTLSLPYLTDKIENEKLITECYERLKKEIRASHILIKVDENAQPADTLEAYNRITQLKKKIEKGADFGAIAREYSDDPSAQYNNGDLGYFTAFQMVFQFENTAFNTKIGQISNPIRTKFGFHIIKATDSRSAKGTMKAAHIMISANEKSTDEEKLNAENKIQEIYEKLKKGEKFEELAQNFSEDLSSSEKGGILPEFGTGTTTRMITEFETNAFSLEKDNDFSAPFKTDFGFHIVKRIQLTPLASFEKLKKEIQSKINRDDRVHLSQNHFIEKLKKEYNYQVLSTKELKWFYKNIDTNYYNGGWTGNGLTTNKELFKIDQKVFTQKEFSNYLAENYRQIRKSSIKQLVNDQFKNWANFELLAFEKSQLEVKYPDFKMLMQEYHDGVLLYEIMTDLIWNKASLDTIGLNTYFEANKNKYMWKERINATIYECGSQKIADKVVKLLKNDTINSRHVLQIINDTSELNLSVKTNLYEKENTAFLKNTTLKKGVNLPYQHGLKIYVVKVDEIIPPSAKLLNETKGLVITDYQNYLEQTWLEELSKKYSFKVIEENIYNLQN